MPDGTVPGRSSEKKGVSGRSWLDTSVGAKADGNGIASNSSARQHERSLTAKRISPLSRVPADVLWRLPRCRSLASPDSPNRRQGR